MSILRNSRDIGKYVILHNGNTLKKGYHNSNVEVWSAGSTVTYYVDSGNYITEEVDNGASCLTPTTFTPTKSGYTFVGWRKDTKADSDVLTEETMASEPIVLYAVFSKYITVKWHDANDSDEYSKPKYYNNGEVVNPVFTLGQGTKEGWAKRGWGTSPSASADVVYTDGKHEIADDITIYGLYSKLITVTYYNNNTVPSYAKYTRYFNASGDITGTEFRLTQMDKSGWTKRGWSLTNAGNAIVYVDNDTIFSSNEDITLYGLYEQEITVTYYNNSTTPSYAKDKRYWAPAGYINPSFKLIQVDKSGWSAIGWTTGAAGDSSIAYKNATAFTRDSNITLYGRYEQTITLKTVANGTTTNNTGVRSYNSNGNIVNPKFTVSNPSKSGATFKGWSWDGSANVANDTITNLELGESITRYAIFTYNNVSIGSKFYEYQQAFHPGDAQGNGIYTTIYSSVDFSKYSGATVTFGNQYYDNQLQMTQNHWNCSAKLIAKCGSNSVVLWEDWRDGSGGYSADTRYGTKTLTFTATSGTGALIVTPGGDGHCDNVQFTASAVLLGRTIVG